MKSGGVDRWSWGGREREQWRAGAGGEAAAEWKGWAEEERRKPQ